MKHLITILICCILFSLISCNSQTNKELQEVLREALETSDGAHTDIRIKFSKTEVINVLVKDSIEYYQNKFSIEKKNRIANLEKNIEYHEKRIAEREAKENPSLVDAMMLSEQKSLLETSIKSLQSLESWYPDYLDTYNGREENEILAKIVTASYSFFNPFLKKQMDVKGRKFLFSADGTRVLKVVKNANEN